MRTTTRTAYFPDGGCEDSSSRLTRYTAERGLGVVMEPVGSSWMSPGGGLTQASSPTLPTDT